jgi:hypothetical protein
LKNRTSIKQIQKGTKNLSCYDQAADGLKCLKKFYNMRTELYIIYKQLHESITENIFREISLRENLKKSELKQCYRPIILSTSKNSPTQSHSNKIKKILHNTPTDLNLFMMTKELKGEEALITSRDYTLPCINSFLEKEWKRDKYKSKNFKFEDSILFKYFVPINEHEKIKIISEKYLSTHKFIIDNSTKAKKNKTEEK